ncbi:uncharacterized protein FFB20_15864 [Fusarium fujikuroi]|nr:uncharacterized protein FFB20_15864 [Fusarium fujikuroi]
MARDTGKQYNSN